MNPKLPYRNQLTIWAQKTGHPEPEYETTSTGPAHEPQFRTCLRVAGKMFDGFGPRRVLAETDASERACRDLLGRKCRRSVVAFMDVDNMTNVHKYEFEDVNVTALVSRNTPGDILERLATMNNLNIITTEISIVRMFFEIGKAIGSGLYDEIHVITSDDFSNTFESEVEECKPEVFVGMCEWIEHIERLEEGGMSNDDDDDIETIMKNLYNSI